MKKKNKVKATTKVKAGKKKTLLGKSLRKLGKKSGLSKLSTTQKVVGGAALLAAGLGYLATRVSTTAPDGTFPEAPETDAAAAEQNLASLDASPYIE